MHFFHFRHDPQLYADVDVDVKNGAQMLDRVSLCITPLYFILSVLILIVVSLFRSIPQLTKDVVSESESFQLESFIPLLRYVFSFWHSFLGVRLLSYSESRSLFA